VTYKQEDNSKSINKTKESIAENPKDLKYLIDQLSE